MCPQKKEEESSSSQFVSGIAGILILVSAAAVLMSILQHELIYTRIAPEEIQEFLSSRRGMGLPKIVRFYFYNLQHMAQAAFGVSIITLMNAIGLSLRKNWARMFFICLFVAGIAWCLTGMFFYEALIPDTSKVSESAQNIGAVMILHVVRGVSFGVSAGFIILFIWLIGKFISKEIRREFMPPSDRIDTGSAPA